jgi:hypothetical protein
MTLGLVTLPHEGGRVWALVIADLSRPIFRATPTARGIQAGIRRPSGYLPYGWGGVNTELGSAPEVFLTPRSVGNWGNRPDLSPMLG